MGLDIHIQTDNEDEIYSSDYLNSDYFYKHSLSRIFCNFISGRYETIGKAKLEQIGKLADIDITLFYDMEKYWDDETIEYHLSQTHSDQEKEEVSNQVSNDKNKLKNNIDKVLETVNRLIDKLSGIDDLNFKINNDKADSAGHDYYFSDFNIDKGDGYIGNNLGHDLRNFKRFLEYAKSKNVTTVWFRYG